MSAGKAIPWQWIVLCLAITALGMSGLLRADELYGRTLLVEKQCLWMTIAIAALVGTSLVPFRLIRSGSLVFYGLSLAGLVVVLFMPAVNGSRRWIPLGLFDFQASEPARVAFILALASYLMHRDSQRTLRGLVPPFVLALVPIVLIIREPDLDTALLFVPVLATMLLTAGARWQHMLAAALLGIACLPLLWTQMSPEQQSRIVTVFLQRDGGAAPAGDGFHLHQSKQVLALGGFAGSARHEEPPLDDPAAWQLPASRTDFVFAMIGERHGFLACALLMVLYLLLVWKGLRVAHGTREPWSRLVAVGITTLIAEQVILNTGMTVGLLPITGTTLPLCSYGGSSLISTAAAIGLLASIERHRSFEVAQEPFGVASTFRATQWVSNSASR